MEDWMIVVVVIAVGSMAISVGQSLLAKGAAARKWSGLKPLVSGTVSKEGLKGTYQGRPVRSRTWNNSAQDKHLYTGTARATTSVSWNYETVMDAGTAGQGQDWEAVHREGRWQIKTPDAALAQRLTAATADIFPDPEKVGLYGLNYNSQKGEVRGSISRAAQLSSSLSDINSGAAIVIPTPAVFQAQLDILTRLAQRNQQVNAD